MTPEQVSNLEQMFDVHFPDAYRSALIDCPLRPDSEEFVSNYDDVVESNKAFRAEDVWQFPWLDHLWWIGGDGAGGFYFISCLDADCVVYYFDHENCAKSFADRDRLSSCTLAEYIETEMEDEKEFREYEEQLIAERAHKRERLEEQIANRKFWQFWIPQKLPKSLRD